VRTFSGHPDEAPEPRRSSCFERTSSSDISQQMRSLAILARLHDSINESRHFRGRCRSRYRQRRDDGSYENRKDDGDDEVRARESGCTGIAVVVDGE
jgi:hypothetical protein